MGGVARSLCENVVPIYRHISMYNGSDSNTSAHTRFVWSLCENVASTRVQHHETRSGENGPDIDLARSATEAWGDICREGSQTASHAEPVVSTR